MYQTRPSHYDSGGYLCLSVILNGVKNLILKCAEILRHGVPQNDIFLLLLQTVLCSDVGNLDGHACFE